MWPGRALPFNEENAERSDVCKQILQIIQEMKRKSNGIDQFQTL